MPLIGGAIAGAGSLLGAGVGYLSAQKDRAAQKKAIKNALAELNNVGYPPDLSKEIIYQQFQQAGILTPQLEQDLNDTVAESQVANIKEDTSLRSAQKQALAALQTRAKVGLSAEDRAALNQVRNEVQRDTEAKRQQLLQNFAARGQGGSGSELMAALQASQGGADLASQQSDSLMAQAQQRALQSLGQSAGLASDIRGQDFNVNQTKAQALDERNRFLAQNSIARQSANVNRLNQAQQLNLAEQQRIQDTNTQMANAEKLRQVQEQGNYWQNKLGLAQAKSNANLGQASQYGQQAQNTQSMFGQIGSGLGKIGAAAYQGYQNKTNPSGLSDEDVEARAGGYME